jgi:hypothetical protein
LLRLPCARPADKHRKQGNENEKGDDSPRSHSVFLVFGRPDYLPTGR